ncbi:MAG TPA: hypothetical protein VES03_06190 [Motilibacterales bacterium]|nr:hypothetical protein [Motilibacterales bacterium]
MATWEVDPRSFMSIGSIVDWQAVARRTDAGVAVDEVAAKRELTGLTSIQLRWVFEAGLGYPRTPFTVWVESKATSPKPVAHTAVPAGLGTALFLDAAYVDLVVSVSAGPGGIAGALAGMPYATPYQALVPVGAGATVFRISGPEVRVITVPSGTTITGILGRTSEIVNTSTWTPIELVGLPGDGRAAAATDLTSDQGMLSAPIDPVSAALDRFRRGAPLVGWPAALVPGVPAPAWQLADPVAIVKLFQNEMLADFIDMVDAGGPADQELREYHRAMATPTGQVATTTFNPLRVLLYGAASDPLAALITGFGTAYPTKGGQGIGLGAIETHASASVQHTQAPTFMVTSTFVTPLGKDAAWAAVVTPGPTLPPMPASALGALVPGVESPTALDGPFRPVVQVSWDALPNLLPLQVGSHAFVRRSITPSGGPRALMDPRPYDTALQPLGASRNQSTPTRRSLSDSAYEIDSSADPNNLRYAVANQDVFGVWSAWAEVPVSVAEPRVGVVTIAGPRLDTTVAAGPCPASATFDLTWNWASRSPARIEVVARRYPQVWPEDPPASLTPPTGDAFVATGAGALVVLEFAPDGAITSVTPGAGLSASPEHLSVSGHLIEPAPLGVRGARRYRVTVSGFELDFDASGRWGLGLWARGVEARFPGRTGPYNTQPSITSASDPRPPVITSTYEAIALASLRDADGQHHANLTWSSMTGAVGYYVYTTTESTFLAMRSQPAPLPSDTLTTRLAHLRTLFQADPDRRPFTRIGVDPLVGTSTQVTLPRGTKDLHLFVVVGVSAGQVESAWPTASDPACGRRFVAFAAPQTVAPGPPELEVSRAVNSATDPDSFMARVRIRSAAGATVTRVDLHRVRVPGASVALDLMGPPIASIDASAGPWTVQPIAADPTAATNQVGAQQDLGIITGNDLVQGSWKPLFYCAVAWGADDPDRGQYGVRSKPSVVRSVVVPPATGPTLGGLTHVLPTAGSAAARIDASTTAMVADTVLGPHRLEAEVQTVDPAGVVRTVELAPAAATLADLPESAPGTDVSGLWREPTIGGVTPLRLLVRRPDETLSLRIRMRITDPLGRIDEKVIDVPPGAATAPDIINPMSTPVVGGVVVAFLTSVPDSSAAGPYRLEVKLKPAPVRPRRSTRAVSMSSALADVPLARRGVALLDASRDAIAVQRSRRVGGQTTVEVGLRRSGVAMISIVAPDGARESITRTIGEGL